MFIVHGESIDANVLMHPALTPDIPRMYTKVYAIYVNIHVYYLLFTGVLAQTLRAEPIVVALGMTFGFRYNILYISI